jgi:hypothetical protein
VENRFQSLPFKCNLQRYTTVWGAKHLPQNRELSMVLGGDGGALHVESI